jgi:hypothetical protein
MKGLIKTCLISFNEVYSRSFTGPERGTIELHSNLYLEHWYLTYAPTRTLNARVYRICS